MNRSRTARAASAKEKLVKAIHVLRPLSIVPLTVSTERRERVEEPVATRAEYGARPSSSEDAAITFYPSPTSIGDSPRDEDVSTQTSDDPMGAYPSIVSRFLTLWLPTDPSDRNGPTIQWMMGVAQLEEPATPLRTALQALAANRVAAANGNSVLYREAEQSYGEALGLLKAHLSTTDPMVDDQALSAARVLMIYEFYASPNQTITGWNAHQQGIFNLATTRGPQSFDTLWRQSFLLDIKNVNFIMVVQSRLRSSFLDPQWRQIGEINSMFAVEHRLYDLGFDFSIILGDYLSADRSTEMGLATRKTCIGRFEEQASGYAQLLDFLRNLRPEDAAISSGDFWNLDSAILAAYIVVLYSRTVAHTREAVDVLMASSMISESERWQLGSLVPKYSVRRYNELVVRTIAAIEHATRDEMGLYGGQKTLFPLRLLMVSINPGEPHFDRVTKLYKAVTISKGLKHAEDLERTWGFRGERM
ncbi:MAG: hypothetical protein Q9162_003071 [Coniocarpon cinnabarinum]